MKKNVFDTFLEKAAEQLRNRSVESELRDFERGVWAEIALHDQRWTTRIAQFFRERIPPLPVVGSVTTALVIGIFTALLQANSYDEALSDSMEARYVESIHAVLRSNSENHRHNSSNP